MAASRVPLPLYTFCLLALLSPSTTVAAEPQFADKLCPVDPPSTNDHSVDHHLTTTLHYSDLSSALFSGLSTSPTALTNGFYSFTAAGDASYGLFLCRGDLSPADCLDCIVFATKDVATRCPGSKQVIIWYDECMLRYSNVSIFGTLDVSYHSGSTNEAILIEDLDFPGILRGHVHRISAFASTRPSSASAFTSTGPSSAFTSTSLPSAASSYKQSWDHMTSEYAMHEQWSVKSDVFNFGVLVLEIITGKKNNVLYQSDTPMDLLSYARKLWSDEAPLDLMDATEIGPYSKNEVTRCIHVALLCVQDDPDARPSMAIVVPMLDGYSTTLSIPQPPAFLAQSRTDIASNRCRSKSIVWSVNEASISVLEPR
ncbi:hypothetical protein RHSIM_Rhsim05G0081300 [Rhododendron simsii]|uniref:Gnk2-homologous domain-containing protein n=1 Tax=Rhododendron simsii TaxID=118357 RepID=A0A834H8I4_RHOSS|nr:hypothetical protein RHSIM_Rhsim05G0081300 [Rhododendron simsii]